MLLAVSMVITFMLPVMASSETSADTGLENAIKAVKEKIEIPKDYNKFTYNINSRNDLNSWSLGWSNEETQKHINVTIDQNNMITNYNYYQNSGYEKKIPKYSKEQGREIAEKFINNLDPKLLPQFKLAENVEYSYSSDVEYSFNYERQVNGINYATNNISVTVNNNTGVVTNYSNNYTKDTTFEDASKIISLEQAKKAFIEKLGLKMVYNVKHENEKIFSYLVYLPKNPSKYVDALTGEVETIYNDYGIYNKYSLDKSAKMGSTGANANVALTPDEINAVKGIANLLSKEDADKKIRNISFFNLDSEFKLTNAYLSKGWNSSDLLIWSLTYSKIINKDTNQTREIQVSIEAKSGDVQNFWTDYYSAEGTKPQKTEEQAKVISDDVLKILVPSNFAKLKYDENYFTYNDKSQNQFTFRYVRVENGIECPSDYVSITYDNLSGNVINMDSNWTKNLVFEVPKETITIDKAYEVLFNKIGYQLQYINDNNNDNTRDKVILPTQTDSKKAVLGYFVNNNKPSIISATTGDILNYEGNIYKQNIISDYTDIKGLKAENQIKILTQMSIGYRENELKPNDGLLQKDYFVLLSRLNNQYYYLDQSLDDDKAIEQMYNGLINEGIITKAEKAPLSTLTREEAAKFFIKFQRFGQIAEIKGIYKSNFKDTNKISPDLLGYVCLTAGLKVMNGSNGYFYPKSKITRLEGLLSIYNYLSNK